METKRRKPVGTVKPKTERPWRAGDSVVISLFPFQMPLQRKPVCVHKKFPENRDFVYFAYSSISSTGIPQAVMLRFTALHFIVTVFFRN